MASCISAWESSRPNTATSSMIRDCWHCLSTLSPPIIIFGPFLLSLPPSRGVVGTFFVPAALRFPSMYIFNWEGLHVMAT